MTNPTPGLRADERDAAPSAETLREVFDLDPTTGVLRWKRSPRSKLRAGDVAGSIDSDGYMVVSLFGRRVGIHRVIFAMTNDYWPETVDHINCDRLDNRPSNLRAATRAENMRNCRRQSNNTSGVKGVTWNKQGQKWVALCRVNGKRYHLGRFTEIQDAASALRAFREQHHKEFARHE